MKILVASKNPVKLESVKQAFSKYFNNVEVKGITVDSGVPKQPFGEQTFLGARNRADQLLKLNAEQNLGADFFVGIEGGIEKRIDAWFAYAAFYIKDREGKSGHSYSSAFALPNHIVEKMQKENLELGDIGDMITSQNNIKQKQGLSGVLTRDKITRTEMYTPAIIYALIPFLNEKLYF